MNILDQLAEHARQRVEAAKQTLPLAEIKRQALSLPKGDFRFEKALAKPGLAFICECKKASPSKGLIAPEFPYLQIAREYEAAGADAISVLTEPKWFLGSDAYLKEIADVCGIQKNLTFHLARHTFATTITLSNGVPIETVSKMLGHTNIETTQIYARVVNEKMSHDMNNLATKLGNMQVARG